MALIHDIQSELLDAEKDVGSTLLKLKILASKLEVDILEDWVTREIEGYPNDVSIPNYRKTLVIYIGDFVGVGLQQTNATIPSLLIAKYAGEKWLVHEISESLSVIDWQIKNKSEETFGLPIASDLKLLLRGNGKILTGMNLIEIKGIIDVGAFIRIQQAVRTKALDLVSKIEKEIPSVANIDIGGEGSKVSATESDAVSNITQQTIYASNVTNINATGDGNVTQVGVGGTFAHTLIKKGIDKIVEVVKKFLGF